MSVANATDALAAMAGDADIIDAKDPSVGALGAVSLAVLREIAAAVPKARLVSAALGDADDEESIERLACAFAGAGTALVKVGFAGVANAERVASLIAAATRGARAGSAWRCGVVAVAYADANRVGSIAPAALIEVAARAGASGVLIDTAHKSGPGLRRLMAPHALAALVARAHSAKRFVALAGQLTADDFAFVRDAGADIAGVRGAACDGGRSGAVSIEKVRALRALCSVSGEPVTA